MNTPAKIGWHWGVIAALAITLLALYPQVKMYWEREGAWHGAYAIFDVDEVAYSAYLRALMDGRARRNDPYTGRDHRAAAPQAESLFSIQFAAPYAVALPARLLGLSAPAAFIALAIFTAYAAALAIFWLLALLSGDSRLAAAGAVFTLCLGTIATTHGEIREWWVGGAAYDFLPFLRRYIPATIFPLFFVLGGLMRAALAGDGSRAAQRAALLAGIVFAVLVFSYFFLWTAAVAWLACLALLWLLARPAGWRRDMKSFAVCGAVAAAALVPYAILLSRRVETMDQVQLLTATRAPDLYRGPLVIGAVVLLALGIGSLCGRVRWRDRTTLFAAAFALTPAVTFNQQIITGLSLQPIHYEQFITNYLALVAVALAFALIWYGPRATEARAGSSSRQEKFARIKGIALAFVLSLVALVSYGWGAMEARGAIKRMMSYNEARDRTMPVALRLRELAAGDGAFAGAGGAALNPRPIVFATDLTVTENLPTISPHAVLWAPHMHVFAGLRAGEDKERFYQFLYYSDIDDAGLARLIDDQNFVTWMAIFGWGRTNPNLVTAPQPVTPAEIRREIDLFRAYYESFTRAAAARTPLAYVVAGPQHELANVDRWYERDAGELRGAYVLYRVRLRE